MDGYPIISTPGLNMSARRLLRERDVRIRASSAKERATMKQINIAKVDPLLADVRGNGSQRSPRALSPRPDRADRARSRSPVYGADEADESEEDESGAESSSSQMLIPDRPVRPPRANSAFGPIQSSRRLRFQLAPTFTAIPARPIRAEADLGLLSSPVPNRLSSSSIRMGRSPDPPIITSPVVVKKTVPLKSILKSVPRAEAKALVGGASGARIAATNAASTAAPVIKRDKTISKESEATTTQQDESKLIAHFQSLNSIVLSRPRDRCEMPANEACEAIAGVSRRYPKTDLSLA
jgi:hypothetical protein